MKKLTVLAMIFAIICLLYSVCVFRVGSGTGFFAVWFGIAIIFAIFSFCHQKNILKNIAPLPRRILFIFIGICFTIFLITQVLVLSMFTSKGKDNLDYIIVLGAQVKENGPSAVTKYRLNRAIEYLNENEETIVIVSGGKGSNEPAPEADVMKEYLIQNGIDEDRILTEDKSLNTSENIAFSAELIDIENDSIGIVTNNFHVFRAVMLARGYGYKNVCGIAAYSAPLYLPNNMLRETFGIVKDFLCGHFKL